MAATGVNPKGPGALADLQGLPRVLGVYPAGGATGGTLVVRSPRGYTSPVPRADMFKHKDFVDVKVDLFARHGSRTWAKIGEFPIERKLLTE